MSRAFTKEDHEIPERDGRKRSVSGLPPGAVNYMTQNGADHFREELEALEGRGRTGNATKDGAAAKRISDLREMLEHATIVPHRADAPAEVLFGTTVTLRTPGGALERHCIVGVDETVLDPQAVSWCSPMAKALLGAEVGQRVELPDGTKVEIVAIA
jgi:transcription elongation GreA/GreB family factor